jgi:hypothetical protein
LAGDILGGPGACPQKNVKTRGSEMPFSALWKEIYRVLKVTKFHKISKNILSTCVTEIIPFNFVVYY